LHIAGNIRKWIDNPGIEAQPRNLDRNSRRRLVTLTVLQGEIESISCAVHDAGG